MTRYLILAHQTATSPQLARTVHQIVGREPDATFTIVVPAAPLGYWRTWEESGARQYADQQGRAAKEMLEGEGAKSVSYVVGSRHELDAIGDELRDGPGYDALIICTLPPGVSRWLKRDLPHQAEREFGLPVTHVVAERVPAHA